MLNLIVAPKKHNPRAERYAKRIVKFLKTEKIEYSVYFSLALEDISASVNELTSLGETEFVVIGDDVVLNEFINSLKDLSKIKLGIIPTSRTNDFANYLNLESSPIPAIKQILQKKIQEVDFLIVNDKKVLNNVLVGASVEILEHFNQFGWKSFITEKIAQTKAISKYNGKELTISSKNSKSKTENVYELIIANGGFSKGKHISPLSNVSDGLFNLIYANSTNQKANVKAMRNYKHGEHIYSEDTKQSWLTNVKVTSADNKIKAILDGRIYNFDKLDVTILEKGLKIYK